jgi:hypothetical protein
MKQDKGLKRNTIDKFYTKESVVEMCIQLVKNHIQIDKTRDFIIEPSAGNGSFINSIKSLCDNFGFYDLEPDHDDIKRQDYLTLYQETLQKNIAIYT